MIISQPSESVEILIVLSGHFTAVDLSKILVIYTEILKEQLLKFLWIPIHHVANAIVFCTYKWRRANAISWEPDRLSVATCTRYGQLIHTTKTYCRCAPETHESTYRQVHSLPTWAWRWRTPLPPKACCLLGTECFWWHNDDSDEE